MSTNPSRPSIYRHRQFGNASRIQQSDSSSAQAPLLDMLRPLFNVPLQPLLHHCFNAPKLMLTCSIFCSSATFGHSAPTVQHIAATLFHHCFNTPKPMLKIWKCFAHSTKCFIFCPSATFGHATPIVQCTAATLVPLLIHCTQALMVPSDHSISLPLLSVPLALPETSKVSFFLPLCLLHAVQYSSASASASVIMLL
jgi:hypothetical protein